jgi:predicted dehydrogenase
MSEKLRIGVIGTSPYTSLMHLPSLASHPNAEIAALCGGRNAARTAEIAAQFAVPQVFSDYRAMIADGGLDGVVIAAPDDLHFPMAQAALAARLHVLCEKPLALTAPQARELYGRAEVAGVVNMVSFTYRFTPHYRHLRQLVAEGFVGRVFHAHFRYLSPHGRDGNYQWRFDAARANGVLGDLGPHVIDLARGCCGEIASVSARLDNFIERPGAAPANDSALLSLVFASGAQGMLHLSALAHVGDRGQQQHVSLHGEAGTLEADTTFALEQVRGARADEQQFRVLPVPDALWGDVDRSDFFDLFRKQPVGARLFVDSILAGRTLGPSFYDGLKVQEVVDAALSSQRLGAPVAL